MSFKEIFVDLDLSGNKFHNSVIGSNTYNVDGALSYGTAGLSVVDKGNFSTVIHSNNISEYATSTTTGNGLTQIGSEISLGGTITSNVEITGTAGYSLNVGSYDLIINENNVEVSRFSNKIGQDFLFENYDGQARKIYVNDNNIFVVSATPGNYGNDAVSYLFVLNKANKLVPSYFEGTGFSGVVNDILLTTTHIYVIAEIGSDFNGNTIPPSGLIRLNLNGTFDNTFDASYLDGDVQTIVMRPTDNRIFIGGGFTYNIAMLNNDGSMDLSTFDSTLGNTVSTFNNPPQQIDFQSDGKIIAMGQFFDYQGNTVGRITRINLDGSYDSTFNNGNAGFGGNMPCALSVNRTTNQIIVVGDNLGTYNGLGNFTTGIYVIDADGDYNTAARSNINDFIFQSQNMQDVQVKKDGSAFYVTGNFLTEGSVNLVIIKFHMDGTPYEDQSNIEVDDLIYSVFEANDGGIYIAGDFSYYQPYGDDTNPTNRITRINANTLKKELLKAHIFNSTVALEYASDLSGTYTNRSLVDKGYVDSVASSNTFTNGLTNNAGEVQLGGTLTADVDLIPNSNFSRNINIGNDSFRVGQFKLKSGYGELVTDGGGQQIYMSSNSSASSKGRVSISANGATVRLTNTDNSGTLASFEMDNTNMVISSDSGSFSGLRYQSDYSANFTNDSLVNKTYVDTSSVKRSFTQSTTINGNYLYDFNVINMNNITVRSDKFSLDIATGTSVSNDNWQAVTFGNGIFVAVAANNSSIQTSSDGINWTQQTGASASDYYSVTYGNGIFVAVAFATNADIQTSPDGVTWTLQTGAAVDQWRDVTYGNGIFVAVAQTQSIQTSPDGVTWTLQTGAESHNWSSIAFGNGVFVATAQGHSNVQVSSDGVTWTAYPAATADNWWDITFGNGIFVAIAFNSNNIMTSPDGVTWTLRTGAISSQWESVAYGDGIFVAIAKNSQNVQSSPDGITWTLLDNGTFDQWYSIAFGNGTFVAISSNGVGGFTPSDGTATLTYGKNLLFKGIEYDIDYSSNYTSRSLVDKAYVDSVAGGGSGWTLNGSSQFTGNVTIDLNNFLLAFNDSNFNRVVFNMDPVTGNVQFGSNEGQTDITSSVGDLYLFSQNGGTTKVSSSTTVQIHSGTGPTAYASADAKMQFGSGQILIDSISGTFAGAEYASDYSANYTNRSLVDKEYVDGVAGGSTPASNWIARTGANGNYWISVTYGNGLFVAVAGSGIGNRIMTSPDGVNWTARTHPEDATWISVTYGNGLFVAVAGGNATNSIMTSKDGIIWNIITAISGLWRSITYGNGLFVAVGNDAIMTSRDTITWTSQTSPAAVYWYSVTYGNGLFVSVASSPNSVMTSSDGVNWTTQTAANGNMYLAVTYGNGLFVAVATDGTGDRIMTSPDGSTWTARTTTDNNFTTVTYGEGTFVALGNFSGSILTSPDGIIWTHIASPEDIQWNSVTYGNGIFVGVSGDGGNNVMTSGKQIVNINFESDGNWGLSGDSYLNGTVNVIVDPTQSFNMSHEGFGGSSGYFSVNFGIDASAYNTTNQSGSTLSLTSTSLALSSGYDLIGSTVINMGADLRLFKTDNTNTYTYELNIGGSSTMRVLSTDPSFVGLQYDQDYSANFSAYSLVDKAYVDGAVAGGGNSWPLTGSASLTGDTSISGGGFNLDLGYGDLSYASITGGSTNQIIWKTTDFPGTGNGSYLSASTVDARLAGNDNTYETNIKVLAGTGDAIVLSSFPTFEGLTYDVDYSANYTDRSLVDKAYVYYAIAHAGTNGGSSPAVTTYKTTITGDNSTTDFVITHSLNSRDIIIQVYANTGTYETVEVGVERTSTTTATIKFTTAPANSIDYRVLVTLI